MARLASVGFYSRFTIDTLGNERMVWCFVFTLFRFAYILDIYWGGTAYRRVHTYIHETFHLQESYSDAANGGVSGFKLDFSF